MRTDVSFVVRNLAEIVCPYSVPQKHWTHHTFSNNSDNPFSLPTNFGTTKCRIISICQFFVPKLLDIESISLELHENILGVQFFWKHSVVTS